MKPKCTISKVPRLVVERKLLMALRDTNQVAILADENDLNIFIKALKGSEDSKARDMADDFLLLKKAAFDKPNLNSN